MTHQSERPSLERCLRPGWHMYWQHQTYRITACDRESYMIIHLENVVTSEPRTIRIEQLMLCEDEDSVPVFAPTLEGLYREIEHRRPLPEVAPSNGLDEKLLQQADRVISVIKQVDELVAKLQESLSEKYQPTEALREACAQVKPKKVGLTVYYDYLKRFRKCHGDRSRIAASFKRRTYNQTKLSRAKLHFLDTMIGLYYREDRATKPAMVYRLAESALEFHTQHYWIDPCQCGPEVPQNLMKEMVQVLNGELPMQVILDNPEKKKLLCNIDEMPSTGFFYQYLHWFESQPEVGKALMNSRYGDGTWEQLYMIFDTFAHLASFPLQYVFADHYLLDVFTVDEATRSRIDRLWVTMLIDAYSRSILGMALLYEEPCIDSIQSALLHAIWPKSSHKALGIDGEWACYGISQQLFLDNAWAHESHSLENLARVIGQGGKYQTIDLVLRPPYKARYGALIESLFGNLSSRIKQELPGAIQSSDPKRVRAAAKKACLLYDDIYRYLQQFIVRYQNTEHDGIGRMTPHQKWMEGMQMGWPDVPPLTPSVRRLFLRMWPETRTITEKGICAFGMHYASAALGAASVVDRHNQKLQYSFRYDPADISTIALFQEERWIGDISAKELRRPDGTLKPTSLWELNMAKDLAKDARGKTEDWLSYLNAAEQLKKLRKGEQDKARRKLKQNLREEGENADAGREERDAGELGLDDDEYNTRLLADFGS